MILISSLVEGSSRALTTIAGSKVTLDLELIDDPACRPLLGKLFCRQIYCFEL